MQKLFFEKYKTSEVTNTRSVINTLRIYPQNFFHIQEAGYLKSLKSHLSRRSELNSYLFLSCSPAVARSPTANRYPKAE